MIPGCNQFLSVLRTAHTASQPSKPLSVRTFIYAPLQVSLMALSDINLLPASAQATVVNLVIRQTSTLGGLTAAELGLPGQQPGLLALSAGGLTVNGVATFAAGAQARPCASQILFS